MFYVQKITNELDLSMFKKVSLKDRFWAKLHDNVFFWMIYVLLTMLFMFVFFLIPLGIKPIDIGQPLALVIAIGWFVFRDGMRGGTSRGKEAHDITVICTDTFKDCTLFRSFIRNTITEVVAPLIILQFYTFFTFSLAYAIILSFDMFMIVKSPGGRRSGDLFAKTQVIYLADWIKYRETFKQQKISSS